MTKHSTTVTVGMDLGDKYSHLCMVDNASGEELERARISTTPAAVSRWFERRPSCRVVLEVGSHSGWVSRLLGKMGSHEVLVADPRRARKLMGEEEKDDDIDAELLARIGRMDPKLLKPVRLRGEQTQCDLAVIRSRDAMVTARTQLINQVRGTVKTVGQRLPTCSSASFHHQILPVELREVLTPTMRASAALTEQIRAQDRAIEDCCQQRYPQALHLQQIAGVGPITALAFVLTLEDPKRFKKSRQVGAYLGLCRRRWKSGDADPELRISKAGDALLRRLLVNSAQYILGHFGPDADLRRWGLRYAERGGRKGKKRAVVAVARKLAVLMHRLWVSGSTYAPLFLAKQSLA